MFNFNVLSVHGISGSSRICPNFNCNYTYRERSLAWLSTPKLCAVRCEPLILLNGHFSDSDGGADGTVGKLSVPPSLQPPSNPSLVCPSSYLPLSQDEQRLRELQQRQK
jgi:hypothetical protein